MSYFMFMLGAVVGGVLMWGVHLRQWKRKILAATTLEELKPVFRDGVLFPLRELAWRKAGKLFSERLWTCTDSFQVRTLRSDILDFGRRSGLPELFDVCMQSSDVYTRLLKEEQKRELEKAKGDTHALLGLLKQYHGVPEFPEHIMGALKPRLEEEIKGATRVADLQLVGVIGSSPLSRFDAKNFDADLMRSFNKKMERLVVNEALASTSQDNLCFRIDVEDKTIRALVEMKYRVLGLQSDYPGLPHAERLLYEVNSTLIAV